MFSMRTCACLLVLLCQPLLAGKLSFKETEKDVHAGADQRTVTADFEFENGSDEVVTIANSASSCSCLSVKVKGGKLVYQPGEKGVIRGVFDMGNFSGEAVKALQVWLEGDPEALPSVTLKVTVHIPVLVAVEPKTLRWDLGAAVEAKVLTITMDHDEPIRVTKAGCSNPNFETRVRTVEEGKKYELEVTPTTTDEQALGVITIDTDCSIARHATQRAFALVRRPPVPQASTE